MGKNQNSVVVLWFWLKFWCMIPMGVKYNHTKHDMAWYCAKVSAAASGRDCKNASWERVC